MNQKGASLIELMIGVSIMATIATALYPLFTEITEQARYQEFRSVCEEVVESKLRRYLHGRAVNFAEEGIVAGDRLRELSSPIKSESSVRRDGAGQATGEIARSGGFFYSKFRYNQFYPVACRGLSDAFVHDLPEYRNPQTNGGQTLQPILGMRECVGSDVAWDDANPSPGCTSRADTDVSTRFPGFKLYVKIESDSPWRSEALHSFIGAADAELSKFRQYHGGLELPEYSRDQIWKNPCPNSRGWDPDPAIAVGQLADPNLALYDFSGAGEGIKVTVTGVLDSLVAGERPSVGGIEDIYRLRCETSTRLTPYRFPARYLVSVDGRIYDLSEKGQNASTDQANANSWVFRDLYTSGAGAPGSSIVSIAVHPLNYSIWVLRSGTIVRYSNCGGSPLNCSIAGDPASGPVGISDLGDGLRPSIQEWTVPPGRVAGIGINFETGEVIAVGGSRQRSALMRVLPDGIACPGATQLRDCTACNAGPCPTRVEELPATHPLAIAGANADIARFTGFFLSPTGGAAFVSDRSTHAAFGGRSTFSSTIYNLLDRALVYPVLTLPTTAVSFSM